MATNDQITRIKHLTKILNKYRDEYYNESRPSVDDSTYDSMMDELKDLEDKADFHCANSPNYTVGYVVNSELPKFKHSYPLLSLDKTKDRTVAANFAKGRKALLMHKLDGLTICLIYENGELVSASTRGNGEEGSLITDNARTFMNIPQKIPYKGHLKVTGEGIIHRDDFEKINEKLPEEDRYKTPRNLAGGSVQQLNSEICSKRKVCFYAFNVLEGFDEINSLSGRLYAVNNLGFDICTFFEYDVAQHDFVVFNNFVNELVDIAEETKTPIDGVVIMYDDIAYGKSLGKTGHHYRNGLALKFKEEEEETTITNIEWQVGRTGKITPVAVFKPVILDNTTVSKASLHNINTMQKLKIRPYATVTVVKSNEIIPQIIKCTGGTSYEFEIPRTCPVCGGVTTFAGDGETINIYCKNPNCPAQSIRGLSYFASKDGMNIDGLSDKKIEKLVDAGIISNPLDIYNLDLHRTEIVEFEGMGEKSFDKLLSSIEKSKNVKLENFIAALGIPNVALSKAKIISREFNGDWNKFEAAVISGFDFTQLDTFGVEINKSIHKYFKEVFFTNDIYKELVSLMKFQMQQVSDEPQIFKDMIFAITGNVHIFASRKEIQKKIESLGGKVAGSVSKKTAYLINNDVESSSSKNKDAKKNDVPIITEEEFLKLINKRNKG